MNRYQLAKLVEWAGTLESRKRMQKVVYMLQAAGCPLDADFFLHRYGPYSQDVAQLTDEMVRQKLLNETEIPVGNGSKYAYALPHAVQQQVRETEATQHGRDWLAALVPYEAKARQFLKADLKELEFASTILFFHQQGRDWNTAVAQAEQFKQTSAVRAALPLAQQAIQ